MKRSLARQGAAAVLAALTLGGAGALAAPQPEAGRLVARRECGGCHAVEAGQTSPLADAPRFAELAPTIPVALFAEFLDLRMEAAHPRMPRLELGPDEIGHLIAYWGRLGQPRRDARNTQP